MVNNHLVGGDWNHWNHRMDSWNGFWLSIYWEWKIIPSDELIFFWGVGQPPTRFVWSLAHEAIIQRQGDTRTRVILYPSRVAAFLTLKDTSTPVEYCCFHWRGYCLWGQSTDSQWRSCLCGWSSFSPLVVSNPVCTSLQETTPLWCLWFWDVFWL